MMNLETFKSLIQSHQPISEQELVVPVYKRLSADLLTPVSAYLLLRQEHTHSFLFESVEGGEQIARYSFLGVQPYCTVVAKGNQVTRMSTRDGEHSTQEANVYKVLQQMLNRYKEIKVPELPRFSSGAVGFMGYDTVRLIEELPNMPPDDRNLPDAYWCFYDTMLAFDHVKHQIILMSSAFIDADTNIEKAFELANQKIENLEQALLQGTLQHPQAVTITSSDVSSNMSEEQFVTAVEKAKNYIYEGDIFQVVLSQRFEMHFEGDVFNLYRALRQVNPSPYLFFIAFEDFSLVGSSPEVLVQLDEGKATLLPIAGTRPRGKNAEEDKFLEQDLLNDPKERAEHVMLVDLGRNDLGRVCQYESVSVQKYAYIERYSHVMHIVSSVSGILDEKHETMDVLAATFPAGTLSGAPKVRAMEIIDELEPTKRGAYGGAVGYIDFSGNLDTCIAIRTMLVRGNTIHVQAGAGIVADSNPQKEYEETQNKARALQQAIILASKTLF